MTSAVHKVCMYSTVQYSTVQCSTQRSRDVADGGRRVQLRDLELVAVRGRRRVVTLH